MTDNRYMTNDRDPRPNGTFAVFNNWPVVGVTAKGNPVKGQRFRGGGPFATRADADAFAADMAARGGNPMVVPVADWSFRNKS